MDVEAVKAEIRRRVRDAEYVEAPITERILGDLLRWIEAQQAAEIRAADGFQGTTVTGDDLMRQHGMKE